MLNSHREAPCNRGTGDYPLRWETAARGSRDRCVTASALQMGHGWRWCCSTCRTLEPGNDRVYTVLNRQNHYIPPHMFQTNHNKRSHQRERRIEKERKRAKGKSYIRCLGIVLYLFLSWSVDDVIDGRRGAENWHICRLEMLDPLMKLHLVWA